MSCQVTGNAPTESEPNASTGGAIYGAALAASAAMANPLCSSLTGTLAPDQFLANYDSDFFQIFVPAGSTLSVKTSDPTGGAACIRKSLGENKYAVGLDTVMTLYDSQFKYAAGNADIDPTVADGSNACSAIVLDVPDASIFYVQVQGYGTDNAGKDFAPAYQLDVKTAPWKCGDGKQNPNEIGDGPVPSNYSCAALGYLGGTLSCSKTCGLDNSTCTGAPAGVEPNDDFATATLGGPENGGQLIGGVDYLKVWADSGSTVTAQTSDPAGKDACTKTAMSTGQMDLDTKLTVFGPDQVQLAFNDNIAPAATAATAGANFFSAVTVNASVSGY